MKNAVRQCLHIGQPERLGMVGVCLRGSWDRSYQPSKSPFVGGVGF